MKGFGGSRWQDLLCPVIYFNRLKMVRVANMPHNFVLDIRLVDYQHWEGGWFQVVVIVIQFAHGFRNIVLICLGRVVFNRGGQVGPSSELFMHLGEGPGLLIYTSIKELHWI